MLNEEQSEVTNTDWVIRTTVVTQGNVLKPLGGNKVSPIYGTLTVVLNEETGDVGYFVTSGSLRTTMVRGVLYASLEAGMVNSICDYNSLEGCNCGNVEG